MDIGRSFPQLPFPAPSVAVAQLAPAQWRLSLCILNFEWHATHFFHPG